MTNLTGKGKRYMFWNAVIAVGDREICFKQL